MGNKKIYWFLGILLTIIGLILTEGSLIVTTKMFGIVKATLIRIVFTIPLSWLVIFLFSNTNVSANVRKWFFEKQASLSHRAQVALTGGKFFVIVNTAIFLGPVLASVLMLMIGVDRRRIYLYAVLCALLSAWVWCCLYGSVCWGVTKILNR